MKQLLTIYFLIISTFGFGNVINAPAIQSVKLSPKTRHKVSIIDKVQCTVSSSRSVSICQGKNFFVQGKNQTKAGTYHDTLKTTLGCDSIITTTLTVNPTYYLQNVTNICRDDSVLINGRYIKTSGLYIDSFKTTLGCDSIIATIVMNYKGSVIVNAFGANALQTTLADKYQWLDCDDNYAPIDSNSNKSATMDVFVTPIKGRYAVEVTRSGCIDTSDCYGIGIATTINYAQLPNIKVYPNPASEQITIDLKEEYANISIDIITIAGQVLFSSNYKNQKILTLNTQHLTEGIYLLRIKTNEKATMVRVTIN